VNSPMDLKTDLIMID